MTAPLVPCIYSTVKNVSGKTRSFGFLGDHGKTLANNAEYTFFGDIVDKLARRGNRRKQLALERALAGFTNAAGVVYGVALHIKNSPAAFLYDSVALVPKQLTLASGVLGVADSCVSTGY